MRWGGIRQDEMAGWDWAGLDGVSGGGRAFLAVEGYQISWFCSKSLSQRCGSHAFLLPCLPCCLPHSSISSSFSSFHLSSCLRFIFTSPYSLTRPSPPTHFHHLHLFFLLLSLCISILYHHCPLVFQL